MYMKILKLLYLGAAFCLLPLVAASCSDAYDETSLPGQSAEAQVEKRQDMRIYVHYMPWFQTKDFSGEWGMHWTMANCNPDQVDADGKRQIASHFYPLIGPYDSSDPVVLDYHALLMKYAGIEGVLVTGYCVRRPEQLGWRFFSGPENQVGTGRYGLSLREFLQEAELYHDRRQTLTDVFRSY